MKIVLTIAGSDAGSGAGIQADLKTMSALGVYGCTAVTTVTSQNTREVSGIFEIPPEVVNDQISSVLSDFLPNAIKIGMVYSNSIITSVVNALGESDIPLIVDPVLQASTGARLLKEEATELYLKAIISRAFVVTPNRAEAQFLSGRKITSEQELLSAAEIIKSLGPKNVVIKGGHFDGKQAIDILLDSNG